jgi:hypothetical protein
MTLRWLLLLALVGLALGVGVAVRLSQASDIVFRGQTATGEPAVVRVSEGPVVVIAHWCPHCEHFLAETPPPRGMVRVVSIWPRPGETLETVVRATQEKLRRTGWGEVPFIVVMDRTTLPRVVSETPLLLWRDAQGLHAENPLRRDPAQVRAVLDESFVSNP